jgi:predicted secreted protein
LKFKGGVLKMAIAGVGTIFNRWDSTSGSSGGWKAIAEINNITGPGMSRDTIDTTALDTEGGYRTFITGFRNAGTITLAMNFTQTTYMLMKGDFEANEAVSYQIILPDADETVVEFDGLVTEIPITIPPDDKITVDVTIQISGPVDVFVGSSGM